MAELILLGSHTIPCLAKWIDRLTVAHTHTKAEWVAIRWGIMPVCIVVVVVIMHHGRLAMLHGRLSSSLENERTMISSQIVLCTHVCCVYVLLEGDGRCRDHDWLCSSAY